MKPPEGAGDGWLAWLEELEEDSSAVGGYAWLDRVADRVLDKAYLSPGESVLDLGAGTGLLTGKAARLVGPEGRVIALDSSGECLERISRDCRSLGLDNVVTFCGRAESLPFETGSLSAVLCRSALSYSSDLAAAVREVRRVLAEGGRFSVFEPLLGELSWSVDIGTLSDEFRQMERTLKSGRGPASLERKALRDAFAGAGLTGFESLVVHFAIRMCGRSEEEIEREYLFDLPGDLAALSVLKREGREETEIVEVARAFAREAAAGRAQGRMPCIFVWGAKEG